jgi:predicted ATPase/DNA-binding SARP family transcriptional activator
MSHLAIALLGPLEVTLDGEPVSRLTSLKAQALLAYLALERGHPHPRASLAALLWPEQLDADALHNLRQALSQLRAAVGDGQAQHPFLEVTRATLTFDPRSDCWLDAEVFGQALAASRRHAHPRLEACASCMAGLETAAGLYRGELLSGLAVDSAPFEEWLVVRREEVHRQVLEVLRALAAYHEGRGEYEAALSYARRRLGLEGWREEAQRQAMRALAASGHRNEALAQYEVCRRVLAEELGVEPEEETVALYERIRAGAELTGADKGRPPAPVRSADRSVEHELRHNLPASLTPFIGRERELAQMAEHLDDPDCRLLTLVGPGGIGKTRLALEVAARQVDHYADGVFFVGLAGVSAVEAIAPTVAEAIGLPLYGAGDPLHQLLDYLRPKEMLLILDNYEHLQAGAAVATEILRSAPRVQIVATSRARLNVEGEQLFLVRGMNYPETWPEMGISVGQYSAVQLFLSSARRVRPDWEPTTGDLADIACICRLVEGMPLGVLLAAAWVVLLTPAEIVAEIRRSLDFLENDRVDVPARQQSLRAVFDHSWKLLPEGERDVFRRLSVFCGGFTWEAARQVTGAPLRDLLALVNRSLLYRTTIGRFDLHELLRQYAQEKLDATPGETQKVRDLHSAYYIGALQRWAADLRSARQRTALSEMDVEIANARAAWGWAAQQGQPERLDRALEGLCWFYYVRGRFEEGQTAAGMAAAGLGSATSGAALRVLAKSWTWQSVFENSLAHAERSRQLLDESLALLDKLALAGHDTRRAKAYALRHKSRIADTPGDRLRALEESLALCQAVDDRWGMSDVLEALGVSATYANRYDKAEQLHEQSLTIRQALGDPRAISHSLFWLGRIAGTRGQLDKAERLLREGIAICQELGDRIGVATGRHNLCNLYNLHGRYAEARTLEEENATVWGDLGDVGRLGSSHRSLGWAKLHLGEYRQARTHAQEALAIERELGYGRSIAFSLRTLSYLSLVEGAHAEAQRLAEENLAVYRELGLREFLGLALAAPGFVASKLGPRRQARQYLSESLQVAVETEGSGPVIWASAAMALLLVDEGRVERAVELYALASRYPVVGNSRWFEDVAGRQIEAAAQVLPPEVVAAAQERGRARDVWATAQELLEELGA